MNQDFLLCPAPAKINLFLHVTGRRPDGYHLLQTAFRMLDHGDTIGVRPRADGQIVRVNDVPGVPADADLVVRAARLLQAKTRCTQGADIQVTKRLPMGGGLGGGSSDAATVLLALNHLWQLDIPRAQLQSWALELGADVPFFVFGRTALGEGVGEALQPLALPPAWYVIVEPPVSVPTVEIFSAKELTRDTKPLIIAGFAATETQRLLQQGRNDLEPVACGRYPVIKQALEALARFGAPRMSGSGACAFLPCAQREVAEKAVSILQTENWKVWYASALDEHPLLAWARD